MAARSTRRRRAERLLWQSGLVLTLCLVWQWASVTHPAPHLPSLKSIALAYWDLVHGAQLIDQVLPSVYRVAVGLLIGIGAGSVIGLAIGYVRSVDPWVRPLLEFLRAVPAAAVLPGALLLLGSTDTMRVSVIVFGCTFPVLLAAIDGARRVDPLLVDTARMCGLSRSQVLLRVIVPAALPQVFAGIRIALGLALIMMVISELLAADSGLGFYILQNQRLFQTANVYAGVLAMGTLAWLFSAGMLQVERRVLRWHRGWRGANS